VTSQARGDLKGNRHYHDGDKVDLPALIARCIGAGDIIDSIDFARENDLLLAVRGGGHNVAGNALCDNSLVIDLSPMRAVRVDPVGRTARVQPGASWGDVDKEAQLYGLVTPGGRCRRPGWPVSPRLAAWACCAASGALPAIT
jgi:FAD/FMN-containing dehydrogenase